MIKVSIAMCTHNGEKFVAEQLESFLTQTQLPDELVISDDASTDRTIEIIENFKQKAPFTVKLYRNDKPLKSTKNFEKVLQLCTNNIIFLSDQDDVWLPEKIERLSETLVQNPEKTLVFSNALLVDEQLNSLNITQLEILRMGEAQKNAWKNGKATELMLMGNRITGCTLAIHKSLVKESLPFPTNMPEVLHDTWLGWIAVLENQTILHDEVLTRYRQHEKQQVGSTKLKEILAKVSLKERFSRPLQAKLAPFKKQFDELQLLYQSLRQHVEANNENLQIVKQKLDFLDMRSNLSANKFARILPVFSNFLRGNYTKFKDQSVGWKSVLLAVLGDVLE